MKRSRLIWLALVLFLSAAAIFSVAADTSPSKLWQKLAATFARVSPSQTAQTTASQYTFQLQPSDVQRILAGAPIESPGTRASSSPTVLRLPHPDGKMRQFRLLESPLLTPEMAAQYPDIKSYTAQGVDDPAATARFSWTSRGLHGIIVGNDYSVFIHPVDHRTTTNYVSYFAPQDERFECGVKDSTPGLRGRTATPGINSMNGGTLRTYRLALTAPAEYTLDPTLGGGTVASTVASFNVWLNQVNAVYEREMSIRFTLVNNTSIIYTNATTDPFTNPTDTVTSLTEVRDLLRTQVGIANYDLGHVLLVGDTGGVAFLGVTCDGSGSANKGGGVSGVPAPLGYAFGASRIMHEMGHQFGATHTFNDIAACASNRAANTAYEPGNGMTIMAYPVQCITPIVPNRELRFHDGSLTQMVNFLGSLGGTCATTMATGNAPPTVSGGPDRTIPRNTPFTLTATGSDPDVNDAANLTYVWEQIDAGGALYGQTTDVASFTDVGDPSTTTRPIFRPFSPSPNPTRTFPSLTYILNNANVPPGIVSGYYTAESLPNVTRTLNFRVTLRDNRAGGGGFSDDHVTLNVDGNSGPFLVTAPNTAVSLPAGSLQTVTWNVNNTNLAPVNCANVKISLSTDGGQTFPTVLAASTPNDGSEVITLPSLTATVSTARIKVEAVGNIFFDLSDANFTISSGTSCPNVTSFAPGAGNTGTSVKIFGTGFTGVTAVKFSNNVSASFTLNSDTQITVTQPAGAASGPLTLSKAGCADTLTANYLVCSTLAGTLTVDDGTYEQVNVGRFLVNRLTPASYPATLQSISVRIASTQYLQVGTPLTLLAGVNADGDTNINNTSFQTSNVTVTAVNTFVKYDLAQPITIYAGDFVVGYTFPNGGATASLDTTSPDNRSYSSEDGLNFSVNTSADYLIRAGYLTGCGLGVSACPTVSGISPANGQIGDTVTINGTGFSGVTSVTFNNNLVTNFTIVSETQITAVVPAGATTGPITLSEPNCADVQSTNFVVDTPVCPTVTGFNPPSGQAGDTVVITGSNFTGVTVVKFAGDAAATFTVDSPTQITATIPTGAQYGPISISKQGCANAQTANFVPCNSTFPLQIDDGSPNTNGGFTGPTTPYYVSRLTPVTYPATLTTVSININSTSVPVGTPITILAGTNTDGDTNINGTTFQTLSATHISAGQYNSYTLTTPVTINAGDFVIGFSLSIPTGSTWFPESRDTDNPQGRSYRSTNSGSTYSLATGNANYLIRGQYYRPCCETLTITTQPSNQVACAGAPASFSVVATGSNLSYQWRKNGSNIVGATSNSYSIPAVAAGDVGSYDVVITNSCNSTVTSNAATLALNPTTAITAPPVNQTVCEGGPASFSVTATGAGLSYQWRKNGAPIGGATNSSFAIPAAAAADAGSYDVVVTGSCGTVTSSAATLTVNSGAAITAPPVNQTVCEGGPASFSVTATGAGLSYQWRKNGAPIGGATNSSFAIPAAAAADAGSYDVVVTGSCGTVTSSAATLTVNSGAAITAPPVNQTVCEGGPASFSVTATGAGLSYQWRKNGAPISGATNSSFAIPAAAAADAGSYDVVVTGSCGTVTSSAATLTVNSGAAITAPPVNQTVCEGGPASFSVTATGAGLSYQWRKNGAPIGGATNSSFAIPAAAAADAGSYDVVVTGSCGTVTSSAATLTVNSGAAITAPPVNQTVCEGGPASFSVTATGTGLSYQWRKNGAPISGATNSSFTIPAAAAADAGSYNVVVTSSCGTITSSAATLTVNSGAAITAPPVNQTVCEGGPASFSVTATGTGLSYQWRKNGAPISGATNSSFAIPAAAAADAGSYDVVVTGSCGTVTSSAATLTVNLATTITAQPSNQATCLGGSVTFNVGAAGVGLSYQWRKNGAPISGATNSSFTIPAASAADAGSYDVVVTGTCGTATSGAVSLTINGSTSINTHPANQTLCLGAQASFSVAANGTGTLHYQWRKNGAPISGATSNSFSIATTTAADAGSYDVVVTSDCGTTTSNAATLAFNSATTIGLQPVNQTVCAGAPASFSVTANGTGPFTYQWRKNGAPISGATNNSFAIPATSAADAGSYDVVINGACGTVTSSAATLTVNSGAAISAPPVNQTVCEGGPASFSVSATGTGLTYQWRKNGAPISGATNSSFAIPAASAADAGSYDVVINSSCGTITSGAATLTVNASTAISSSPVNQTVCAGSPANFSVTATGANLTYQWRKNGAPISGATNSSFAIPAAAAADAGSYDVVVTGSCGTVTSGAATLTVNPGTAISSSPVNQTVCAGSPANFSVTATGTGLSYQWRKNGAPISGATNSSFAIPATSAADAGSYDVVVTGSCGTITSGAATLTVNASTAISSSPVNQTVCAGSPANFSVTATGANLTYQWRKNGAPISGATNNSFAIPATLAADAGSYDVVVTGSCGTVTSSAATLTVNAATAITTQPANQTVTAGQSATFTVVATGTNLTYQWRKQGANGATNIPGATNSSYTIPSVTTANAGGYDVVVTGACGTVTSSTAVLTVGNGCATPVVTITAPSSGVLVQKGTTVNFSGSFTDASGGTHTATWAFDSLTQNGVVNEASGTVTASRTFSQRGVYLVSLTVRNSCGNQATASLVSGLMAMVVVYDPSPGYVAGGGWIVSPAGAYPANPALVGNANFGFSTRYRNNNNTPTADTEFQFHLGDLHFRSTSYDVAAFSGAKAQYRGDGQLSNAGNYRFILTIIDGQLSGGGGKDKFRIKIWNNQNGALVYDNQLNASDNANPTTIIAGGSIVIYKGANGNTLASDYDGDGKSDLVAWNKETGQWLLILSADGQQQTVAWGAGYAPYFDVPTPGDFDGDGKTDLAVFRRGDGHWYIKRSSDGGVTIKHWGLGTDEPVAADYDGDGITDIAVWRASEGRWYIQQSSDNSTQAILWGAGYAPYHDVAVPGDYDGDGLTDLAVFRRGNGHWYIKRSSDGATVDKHWGLGSDTPVAADYDGDGVTDIAVWRGTDTNWYILQSSDEQTTIVSWGSAAQPYKDIPTPADYDGDGLADIAIWRTSENSWYIRRSSDGQQQYTPTGLYGVVPTYRR